VISMEVLDNKKLDRIKKYFAIIVVSYIYTDLWSIFFKLFYRFWPDCPFKVYFFSNHVENKDISSIPKVRNILIKNALSWSEVLKKGLNYVDEEYIFLLLDDFFLVDFVDTNKILNISYWILKNNINYLRMIPTPKPDKNYNELVGIVSKGTIYRTSISVPVWKKKVLSNLLKIGESAWEFEIYGTIRSDNYDKFFSTWKKYFSLINGIVKGKWQRNAVKKINSLGIEIDLDGRDMMTFQETIKYYFAQKRSKLLHFFPAKHRRKIRNYLKGKCNYINHKSEI